MVVVLSFALPVLLANYLTLDDVLVARMRDAPVGLVFASLDGQTFNWFVRIGGEATPVATGDRVAGDQAAPEPESPGGEEEGLPFR